MAPSIPLPNQWSIVSSREQKWSSWTSRLPFGGKGRELVVVRAFKSFILKLDMTVSPFFLTFLSKIVDTMAVRTALRGCFERCSLCNGELDSSLLIYKQQGQIQKVQKREGGRTRGSCIYTFFFYYSLKFIQNNFHRKKGGPGSLG